MDPIHHMMAPCPSYNGPRPTYDGRGPLYDGLLNIIYTKLNILNPTPVPLQNIAITPKITYLIFIFFSSKFYYELKSK